MAASGGSVLVLNSGSSSVKFAVSSAARRPTVSARLMVNSTLGPGMAIRTLTTAANVST
jgi:acetate kinase